MIIPLPLFDPSRRFVWEARISSFLSHVVVIIVCAVVSGEPEPSEPPVIIKLGPRPTAFTAPKSIPPPPKDRQVQKLAVRPTVPVSADYVGTIEDEVIESDAEGDTNAIYLGDLAMPGLGETPQVQEVELEDEEPVEIWKVEKQPEVLKQVKPDFPEIARKAGIEGRVTVNALVGKDGKVEKVGEITGPEVFHEAAKAAALQWEFTPAIQNDRPVKVWVAIPFNFTFRD
ncbi:MAG: TonB family protein [Candidatus Latescibacteria bacterium]|nr:TonB family protein [Candidatus Latescibacterota bacterium]